MSDVHRAGNDERRILVRATVDPTFKLVFLATAGGTFLLLVLCIALSFWIGPEPRPLFERLVEHLLDLTKLGFGAVAGLLGGRTLQGQQGLR
jgi:hypothetical protein